jgi:hypothetical protein
MGPRSREPAGSGQIRFRQGGPNDFPLAQAREKEATAPDRPTNSSRLRFVTMPSLMRTFDCSRPVLVCQRAEELGQVRFSPSSIRQARIRAISSMTFPAFIFDGLAGIGPPFVLGATPSARMPATGRLLRAGRLGGFSR